MDEILLEDIEVFAHHGYFDFEKINGQNFYISARMAVRELTHDDDLSHTIDYGKVATDIGDYVANTTYDLIESVAHGVAHMILVRYPLVESVEVTIKKPDAPIPMTFGNVSVTARERRHVAYIALGSNIGDREGYLNMAIAGLDEAEDIRVTKVATFINTPPYGVTDQDDFLNTVVRVETLLTPHALLNVCQSLERQAGRVRTRRWGERTLDVDIILFDDEIVNDDTLIIPHLELHMRDFVLRPLVEIAPGVVHPVLHKTAYTMLKELER